VPAFFPTTNPQTRHVMLLDADAGQVASIRAHMPADSILELAVRRNLHQTVPMELQASIPYTAVASAKGKNYQFTITGGGAPLPKIEVLLYLRDPSGQTHFKTVTTDARGKLSFKVPNGFLIAFVEPIPCANFWIMFADAPASGSTIDCIPIAKAKAGGSGWWNEKMGVDVKNASRGAGIKVGVIDTGCGHHRNLKHVTLVGAFVDGKNLPGSEARDVAEHGTHTTGII